MTENTPQMTPAQVAARVAEIIRSRPDMHDQESWLFVADGQSVTAAEVIAGLSRPECGTRCCVAGWAAVVTSAPGTVIYGDHLTLPNGRRRQIEFVGAEALGLDASGDMPWLFEDERTRDEVLAEVDRIAGGGTP
jgi:hypothetical protein